MKYELTFLAGLAAGAALGVIFAARSGKETRKAIREKAQEGADQIASAAGKVRARVKDVAARGKEQIGDAVEAGKDAFQTQIAGA
jgi:gas vesicle protein